MAWDWGGAGTGAAGGASAGAAGGPIGMGIGALVGGALGGLGGGDEAKSPEEQMEDLLGYLFDYQQGPHIANQILGNLFGLTAEQSNPRIRQQMWLDLKAQGVDVPKWVLNPKKQAKKRNQLSRWEEQIAKLEEGGVTEKEQKKLGKLQPKVEELSGFLEMPSTWGDLNPKTQPLMEYLQQPVGLSEMEQQIANAIGLDTTPGDEAGPGTDTGGFDLMGGLQEATDYLRGTVLPMTEDLARTGWKTDIQPIIDQEVRRLNMETAPGLAERYGLANSGLGSYLGRALKDLGVTLGAKEFEAGESAAERRMFGLGQLPRVAMMPSIFETEGLGNLIDLASGLRGEAEGTRPGGRLLSALVGLSPTASGMGIPMMTQPEEGGGMGGALGSLLASPNFPGMGDLSGVLKLQG